jgi:predicted nucleic acid-binding protein
MRFWDSSAIIPLCVEEQRSENMRVIAKEDSNLAVWWGTSVECCSAFARIRRENTITLYEEQVLRGQMEKLAEYWGEISPSEEVRVLSRRLLLRHALRAADSLQLAAAIVWAGNQPEGFDFVCLDKRLREAAQTEGFTVWPVQQIFDLTGNLQ